MTVERDEFERFADDTTHSLERIEDKLDRMDDKYLTRRDAGMWSAAAVAVVAFLKFLKVL